MRLRAHLRSQGLPASTSSQSCTHTWTSFADLSLAQGWFGAWCRSHRILDLRWVAPMRARGTIG